MEIKRIVFIEKADVIISATQSSIDNNNRDNEGSQGRSHDSDYRQDAPTFNKTRDDLEKSVDTISTEKRIPKDSVEIKSKGNASSV